MEVLDRLSVFCWCCCWCDRRLGDGGCEEECAGAEVEAGRPRPAVGEGGESSLSEPDSGSAIRGARLIRWVADRKTGGWSALGCSEGRREDEWRLTSVPFRRGCLASDPPDAFELSRCSPGDRLGDARDALLDDRTISPGLSRRTPPTTSEDSGMPAWILSPAVR